MPAYSLPIARVLDGGDINYSTDSENFEPFSAPGAKILFVDDIATNLMVGEGLLEPYGVSITMCGSGQEAIEAVKHGNYDLVFMDHMMPETDGFEAVRVIRGLENRADLPIIALTANAIAGAREMFLQNGFNDYLSKPIVTAKLHEILLKWIPGELRGKSEE
jgi:CheY-like chemotaxis protein